MTIVTVVKVYVYSTQTSMSEHTSLLTETGIHCPPEVALMLLPSIPSLARWLSARGCLPLRRCQYRRHVY